MNSAEMAPEAYRQGAEGVPMLACHPGDCHYKERNFRATERHRLLLRLFQHFGIEDLRALGPL